MFPPTTHFRHFLVLQTSSAHLIYSTYIFCFTIQQHLEITIDLQDQFLPPPPTPTHVGMVSWVPTNLRGHHSDVVPGHVLSVQGLGRPYDSSLFIYAEVPHSFHTVVYGVPVFRF